MAAKKTAELIPLCHHLAATNIQLSFIMQNDPPAVQVSSDIETYDRTGAEIEALNAVQVALLTIYDMCKAIDRGMVIQNVRLLEKTGGRSGDWRRPSDSESSDS